MIRKARGRLRHRRTYGKRTIISKKTKMLIQLFKSDVLCILPCAVAVDSWKVTKGIYHVMLEVFQNKCLRRNMYLVCDHMVARWCFVPEEFVNPCATRRST